MQVGESRFRPLSIFTCGAHLPIAPGASIGRGSFVLSFAARELLSNFVNCHGRRDGLGYAESDGEAGCDGVVLHRECLSQESLAAVAGLNRCQLRTTVRI